MSEFKTMTIDGEAYFLTPWENQKGTRYGPTDYDEYEVTIIGMTEDQVATVTKEGRNATKPKEGMSKDLAGIKEYYQITSQYKIPIADSQTTPIPDGTFIPNGSKIRAYVEVRPLKNGKSDAGNTHKLLCKGVQVLEMADMPDDGWEPAEPGDVFASVSGGYVAGQEEQTDAGFEKVLPEDNPLD